MPVLFLLLSVLVGCTGLNYAIDCDRGDAAACYNYWNWQTTNGSQRDLWPLLQKACKGGIPAACNKVGEELFNSRNLKTAKELFLFACQKGEEAGCKNLEQMPDIFGEYSGTITLQSKGMCGGGDRKIRFKISEDHFSDNDRARYIDLGPGLPSMRVESLKKNAATLGGRGLDIETRLNLHGGIKLTNIRSNSADAELQQEIYGLLSRCTRVGQGVLARRAASPPPAHRGPTPTWQGIPYRN